MPCNCDYMNPTEAEIDSRETAQNLEFVLTSLGHTPAALYRRAAENYYGDASLLNDMTVLLCKTLRDLEATDAEKFEQLVYNGRNKQSRQLAIWWERHEEADRNREAVESADADRKRLVKQALAKLTDEEKAALKDTWGE